MQLVKVKNSIVALISLLFVLVALPSYKSYAEEDWLAEYVGEYNEALSACESEYDIMGSLYLCDSFEVKKSPDFDSETVITTYSGQLVFLKSCFIDDDYNVWYLVDFNFKQNQYEGYVLRKYIAISDERFLELEEEYGMHPDAWDFSGVMLFSLAGDDGGISPQGIDGEDLSPYDADVMTFPESYREALQNLKDKHPGWTFVKVATGLDYDYAVNSELQGARSLVSASFAPCTKEAYNQPGWYYASKEILSYYFDPRNSLDETHIFQFEQLTFNESYHKKDALEKYLDGTFMAKDKLVPGMTVSFVNLIYAFSQNENINVSPFMIAARIIQEQGREGNSSLISGVYPGYEGYYNYFNIGANGKTTEEIIKNGLEFAKNNWAQGMKNSYSDPEGFTEYGAYNSLVYGARFLSGSYINNGQDTLYFQKYNVSPLAVSAPFGHQYMQNISAPYTEGASTKKMYENAGSLECDFVFKIPVYDNMPETPQAKPTSTTNAIITLPADALSKGVLADTKVWIDGIECSAVKRNGYLVVDTKVTDGKTAVVYKYNASGTQAGMYVWLLEYKNGAYNVTYEAELEDLLSYHGFSIRISGDSGIRFKSGIDTTLKAKLISTGVDGYKLKEYGTIAMNDKNRSLYPFIEGGEKVSKGIAYGTDSKGTFHDDIFETVDGRARFTNVLMGLPASRYKTDYAFRSYIILNNGSRSVNIYGYPIARSIYYLSEKMIDMKYYEAGSSADTFLRTIISDANAAEAGE